MTVIPVLLSSIVIENKTKNKNWSHDRKKRAKDLITEEVILKVEEEKLFQPHLEKKKIEVTYRRSKKEATTGKTRKIFDVTGKRIEQVVKMTDINNPEGMERIYHFMKKMGIKKELISQGAKTGDRIRISGKTFIMRAWN